MSEKSVTEASQRELTEDELNEVRGGIGGRDRSARAPTNGPTTARITTVIPMAQVLPSEPVSNKPSSSATLCTTSNQSLNPD